MNIYFSTFGSGLGKIIKSALIKQVKDVRFELLLDGLVVYKTTKSPSKIKNIRFFNNTFILLKLFEGLKNKPIEAMIKQVLNNPELAKKASISIPHKASTFRIIASQKNQLVSVDSNLLKNLEKLFSNIVNLQVDRANPDIEIWFLWRSEGYGFFGIRITHKPNYKKVLEKGELKPELANILCLISDPKPNDIFLDPFAGHGAIPIERAKSFAYKQIIASEKSKVMFRKLRSKLEDLEQKIIIGRWNALNLSSLSNGSINKIVTDPPWGIYSEVDENLENFYSDMLKEFTRVLKNEGVMVILMGQKEVFEKVLESFNELKLLEKYDILVSGKKAGIYKIKKL